MSAATLVDQADQHDVERIRRARSLRPTVWWLLMVVAAAVAYVSVPWAWQEADEHGHRTALVVSAALGLAPFAIAAIRLAQRGRFTPAPSPQAWSLRRNLGGTAFAAAFTLAHWTLAWWLLQQEGRWAALALVVVVPLAVFDLLAPFSKRLAQVLIALRRLRARSRDAKAVLAERELDEIAWTIANRGFQNGASLRDWIDREHPELTSDVDVLPAVSAADRGLTGLQGFLQDGLAPGLRRRLPNGTAISVQPVAGEKSVVVTTPTGQRLDVSGLRRPMTKPLQWKAHAGTVLAGRIAAGPVVLANAARAGTSAAGATTHAVLLIGGGEQAVPLGWTADRSVWLGGLAPNVDLTERVRLTRLELLVPPPRPSTLPTAEPSQWPRQYRTLTDATRAVLPELEAIVTAELGVEALRLTAAEGGRSVHLVPLDPIWVPLPESPEYDPGVLIVCPEIDLVMVDSSAGSNDRADAIAAIVALLRGEEVRLTETVHVKDRRIYAKPRRGTAQVDAYGLRLGPLTVWSPIPLGDGDGGE